MPGARFQLEELARKKEDLGELDLAYELYRIAETLPHAMREIPPEVDALMVAHYAARPVSAIWGEILRESVH